MRIQLHLASLLGGLLCLSLANKDSAGTVAVPVDTSGNGRPVIKASFASAEMTLKERFYTLPDLGLLLQLKQPAGIQLGITRQGRPVNAWYFPGTSDKRALVIGGVHGSELSSIEVAQALVEKLLLQEEQTYYSVIVIPSLFPDNAAMAMKVPEQAGSVLNIGRYTHENAVDPNRQMPSPGKDYDDDSFADHLHRTIETENQFLLQLIRTYKPERIANVHSIRNTNYGGIYADPRTDEKGIALGYASDSSLAVDMAMMVDELEGNVAGNHLAKQPTALYYKDPVPVPKGDIQKRNTTGSALKAHRGSGISMGTWGTTSIKDDTDSSLNRNAMRVITIEIPGAKRSFDYKTRQQQNFFRQQAMAFVNSIEKVFLGEHHVE
jgi:hypothetical protein